VVGHAAPPTNVVGGVFAETMPDLGLHDRDDLVVVALDAAVLAHHPADQPLGCPVKLSQVHDGSAAALWTQQHSEGGGQSIKSLIRHLPDTPQRMADRDPFLIRHVGEQAHCLPSSAHYWFRGKLLINPRYKELIE
jgi:hypothetical protein